MSLRSVDVSLPPGILKDKDVSELEKLQEDEAHFVEFFSALELDSIAKVKSERVAVVEMVRNLALETSNLKPDYEGRKSRLLDTSIRGVELKQEYSKQYDKLKELIGVSDQCAILKNLQDSVKVSEQQAEDSVEDFLAGKTEQGIEDLVQTYLHQRTVYWLRKVKSEKLMELNRQPPEPPSARPYPPPSASSGGPPPYPSFSPSSSGQPTPYGSYPPRAAQPSYRYPPPVTSTPSYPTQSMPAHAQPSYPTQSMPPQPRYQLPGQSMPPQQPSYPPPGQSMPPHSRPPYHPPPTQSYPNRPPYQPQPGYSLQGLAGAYHARQPQYPVRQPAPQYPPQQYHHRR